MIICFEKYRRQNKALVLGSDRMCTVLKKIRNKSAIELLEEYGLDKTVPIDIEQLLRAIGISAIGKDFSELEKRLGKPKGSILGMLLSSGNNAAIFYRKDDSYNRRRFTIAHELAHAINHSDNEPHIEYRMAEKEMEENPVERDANIVAGEILIPLPLLKREYLKLDIPSSTVLANIFKVSQNVMEARLKYLKIFYVNSEGEFITYGYK